MWIVSWFIKLSLSQVNQIPMIINEYLDKNNNGFKVFDRIDHARQRTKDEHKIPQMFHTSDYYLILYF